MTCQVFLTVCVLLQGDTRLNDMPGVSDCVCVLLQADTRLNDVQGVSDCVCPIASRHQAQ